MQAIILAAGMGKRLKELTKDVTKCMVKVNGETLIERALRQLDELNLSKIVIVVGYQKEVLMDYIEELNIKTPIIYVHNDIYFRTNNIYSLYLAKDHLLNEDTLLLESDLIFEKKVLKKLIDNPEKTLALVAKFKSWMDGTVVTLDDENNVLNILSKNEFMFEDTENYYKTVNIYKFGKEFSKSYYVPFLKAYSIALGNNEYYEQVLRVIVSLDKPVIKALNLDDYDLWYEIDNIQDLNIAETLFAYEEEKLSKIQERFGGYWRYPNLIDFCYLVNPYYPNKKLISEMKSNFEKLLCDYPSGLNINNLLAANFFGIRKEQICVGNGAAEIIKELMGNIDGKIGMLYPTFQEYSNRKSKEDIVSFYVNNKEFSYNVEDIISYYDDKRIDALIIINPDNPSGNYIEKDEILRLAKWTSSKNIRLIVDESFIDFVDNEKSNELLESELLDNNKNLIVIKSISKSYGVPGLRLGVMATSDKDIIELVKKEVSIWNINSFAEFYMQIAEKYKPYYEASLVKIKKVRKEYIEGLQKLENLRVIPSQANYVMCELLPPYSSKKLAQNLLYKYKILIKDLSGKEGINNKQYIRLAVRREKENNLLIEALKSELV